MMIERQIERKITQEQVDSLPIIPLNEFNEKIEKFKKENWLVNKLINELGSWENFPPHLIRDLFYRLGSKPQINKY